jgi:hypothetical protein
MYHRRKLVWTPRRAAAVIFIALLFAFVASWTSLPARAGGSAPSIAAAPPRHMLAVRTGVVYPLNLPRPSAQASFARHSRSRRIANPFAYAQRQAAVANDAMLPELPSIATLALTDTPTLASSGFAGLAFPNSQCGPGCEPPSMGVAAGPSNVVEVTNIVGRIFDKSGNDLSDFNLNTFFGVATDIFSSDPRIEYDTLSQRWFISFLTFDTTDPTTSLNGFWNLAVSTDSNPLDGFNTYQVETPGDFPDQPPLGFNDDKVVTGGNSFSCDPDCNDGPYEGNEFLVWNKSELLAGAATIDTDYNPPNEDSSDFPIIPAKSRTSTSTLWMVSACVNTFSECNDSLNLWSVTGVPGVGLGSSASFTTPTISEIDPPPVAPQKGNSSNPIDTGDGRLLDAAFRDGLLWASGNASCTPPSDTIARSCLQYVEVETGASPTVGRDFPFGTKGAYDYYPSIDLDSADDLITSFTQSSGAEYPSAYVDGRLATEVNNVLGTPVVIQAGSVPYNSPNPESFNSNAFPWGDYSGAGIDPTDQTAVWVAAEYSASQPTPLATPNWGTWIAEARVVSPSPTPTSTGSPTPTATATSTATATPTPSGSPTTSASATSTASATATATSTSTASGSPTTSASATPTASATATATSTASGSPTVSATPTASTTATATVTPTATATATSTATATASATQTMTPTATATATPVGTLSVSGNLSFGKVKVNATKKKKLKIKNKGKFPLQVIIGDTLKPPFSVPDIGIFTLGKKKTLTVTVLFKPTVAGPTPLQILIITSNDPHHPAHPENATGSGK